MGLLNLFVNACYRSNRARWRRVGGKGPASFFVAMNEAARKKCGKSDAYTLGTYIYFKSEEARRDKALKAHEMEHVYQFLREGILFEIKYVFYNKTVGYWHNPYEVAARKVQRKAERFSAK